MAASLVADEHLVSAPPAPGDAVQKKFAVAGRAAGFGAHIFGPVVSYDSANSFIRRPVDVGRKSVFHDDPPFIHRPQLFSFRRAITRWRMHARTAINKGASIGRIL